MGKGDKKSKRGKIIIGSYGVRRPRKKNKTVAKPVKKTKAKAKTKK
jgi:30S ribosomal protein S31